MWTVTAAAVWTAAVVSLPGSHMIVLVGGEGPGGETGAVAEEDSGAAGAAAAVILLHNFDFQ